jgi:two-component system OmpR family sensor kinase
VVTDNGEGFDPAMADQLFERFYRGDTSRTADGAGSGIGLTIAKAIVQAHHGQLLGHSEDPAQERDSRSPCRSPTAATTHRSDDQTQSRLS